jgi:hypothetical protein
VSTSGVPITPSVFSVSFPARHAAFDEEVPRGRVDPAEEIGEPDDARRVAVAELDALTV